LLELNKIKMTFKIGDKVAVLDDNLSGIVTKISDSTITIETSDGFDLTFSENELVKIDTTELRSNIIVTNSNLSEKETSKRRFIKSKKREKEIPAMEVDLHIHKLTKSTRGMTNHDMLTLQLDTARRQLEFAIRKRIPKIVFIHGVGEGVLKLELEYLFGRYDSIEYYDANYQKYGVGATEVRIFQNR